MRGWSQRETGVGSIFGKWTTGKGGNLKGVMGFETICEGGVLGGCVNDDSGYLAVDLGGPG